MLKKLTVTLLIAAVMVTDCLAADYVHNSGNAEDVELLNANDYFSGDRFGNIPVYESVTVNTGNAQNVTARDTNMELNNQKLTGNTGVAQTVTISAISLWVKDNSTVTVNTGTATESLANFDTVYAGGQFVNNLGTVDYATFISKHVIGNDSANPVAIINNGGTANMAARINDRIQLEKGIIFTNNAEIAGSVLLDASVTAADSVFYNNTGSVSGDVVANLHLFNIKNNGVFVNNTGIAGNAVFRYGLNDENGKPDNFILDLAPNANTGEHFANNISGKTDGYNVINNAGGVSGEVRTELYRMAIHNGGSAVNNAGGANDTTLVTQYMNVDAGGIFVGTASDDATGQNTVNITSALEIDKGGLFYGSTANGVAGNDVIEIGQLTNWGTFIQATGTNRPTVKIGEMSLEQTGTFTTDTLYMQADAVANEITVTDRVELRSGDINHIVQSQGDLYVYDERTLQDIQSSGGTVHNSGQLTLANASAIDHLVQGAGKIVMQGDTGVRNLEFSDSGVIENAGQLEIGTLAADGANYIQQDGTVTTENGWFENSSISIAGGELDFGKTADKIDADGKLGNNNRYTISGGTVTVDTLDSASSVNLTGGLLAATIVDMDGQAVTVDGGTLKTTIGQIFESPVINGLEIDARLPSDIVEVDNPVLLQTTGVGDIKESVRDGITFVSGELALDNSYTRALVADTTKKIRDTYQANDIAVTFLGKLLNESGWTVDIINELNDSGTKNVVFAQADLENVKSGSTATELVIGTATGNGNENVIAESMGFSTITNADRVTVNNDKTLVLVGKETDVDLVDSGVVNVDHGYLVLGSNGMENPTRGTLDTVTLENGGTLKTVNGEFAIDTVTLDASTLGNDGNMTVGVLTGENGSTVDNAGTLNGTEIRVDTLTNGSTGSLTATNRIETDRLDNAGRLDGKDITTDDLDNAGTIKSGTVTVENKLTNTGTLETTGDLQASEAENRSEMTIAGNAVIDNLTNNNGGNMTVSGNLDTDSISNSGSLTGKGQTGITGTLTNDGTASFDDLVVENTGKVTNRGNMTVEATINGLLDQTDGILTGTLTMEENGIMNITGGGVTATVTLSGGDVNVSGGVSALDVVDDIRTAITVNTNGHLTLGADNNALIERVVAEKGWTGSVISVEKPVNIGNGGSISIGNGNSNHDLYFGPDSLTIVNTSQQLPEQAMFTNTGGQANVYVAADAKLYLEKPHFGKNTIVKGYDTSAGGLADGGWDADNLWSSNDNLMLVLKYDGQTIWVDVSANDIRDLFPDIVMPNNINDVINNGTDTNSPFADERFISRALNEDWLNQNLTSRVINSVTMIGAAGGATPLALSVSGTMLDAADRHLSFGDYGFSNGYLKLDKRDQGVALWVDTLAQHNRTDGAKAMGFDTGYSANWGGLIVGADYLVRNGQGAGTRVGLAAAVADGKASNRGYFLSTDNDFSGYGLIGYAARNIGRLNVIGSLGYIHNTSDIDQKLPSSLGMGNAGAKIDNDIFSAGIRAEGWFDLNGKVSFMPYVGMRYLYVMADDYTTKIGGEKAFRNHADDSHFLEIPLGMALTASTHAGGWKLKPQLDMSVIPVVGNKSPETAISGVSIGALDTVSSTVSDDVRGQVHLGIMGEKGDATFGLSLASTVSSTHEDHALTAHVRVRF